MNPLTSRFRLVEVGVLFYLFASLPTAAQIVPDASLPVKSSVTLEGNTSIINGGTRSGGNLFHSFEQFSVLTGREAHFNNALDIQNIISRVTGGEVSNIDGLIRANGTANLFLLNPNGIIFGPNTSLNIGGSFVGSTASAVNFADGTQFSATTPQTTPLLTVSVPFGLQFGRTAGSILNQSQATNSSGQVVGLHVQPSKTLALVGGSVRLDSGILQAPGGRVELGGVAGAGTVGLQVDGNNLSLSFPDGVARADVSLTNKAQVSVRAGGGGSIAVNARNIEISGVSKVQAGIGSLWGPVGAQAGNIDLSATGAINVEQQSAIENNVEFGAIGNSGDINITTGILSVSGGAKVWARSEGRGDAGSVTISASDTVSLADTVFNDQPTVGSDVVGGEIGNGKDINITARSVFLTDWAIVAASILYARGENGRPVEAGNVMITASDQVSLNNGSAVYSEVGPYSIGNGGTINIKAASVSLDNGAQLVTRIQEDGEGNGGHININTESLSMTNDAGLIASTHSQGPAGSVTIMAHDTFFLQNSRIFSTVEAGAVGDGGKIDIKAGSLSLTDGAQLLSLVREAYSPLPGGSGNAGDVNIDVRNAVTLAGVNNGVRSAVVSNVETGAVGNAGNININAGSLSLTDGAQLLTLLREASDLLPGGRGEAGDVNIDVRDAVTVAGVNNGIPSVVQNSVSEGAIGNGGNINIKAGALSVTNGARLDASTSGQGDAGSVTINARDTVSLDGVDSGLFSSTDETASGQGGKIGVTTAALHLSNGAVLSAQTSNDSRGGSVIVDTNNIEITGGGKLLTTAFSSGQAGDITVNNSSQLTIADDAGVAVDSQGTGNGGSLQVQAGSLTLENRAFLSATANSGEGGNMTLNVQDLLLMRRNSRISATAGTSGGSGNGGNIKIDTKFLVAVPNEDSDITANAFNGQGGNIKIAASGIFGIQRRKRATPQSDITASSQFGVNGVVNINTPDVDPSVGLVALPMELVDASGLIASGCAAVGENKFIVTGRGGLPPSPSDTLSSDTIWTDLRSPTQLVENQPRSEQATNLTKKSAPTQIVEAQRWVINNKGEVVLTATAPTVTPHSHWQMPADCHAP